MGFMLKDVFCGKCGVEVEIDLTDNDISSKCRECGGRLVALNKDSGVVEVETWINGRLAHIARELDEVAVKLDEIEDSRVLAFVDNAITAVHLARQNIKGKG